MGQRWLVRNKHEAEQLCEFVRANATKGLTFEIYEEKLTSQQNKAVFAYLDHVAREMEARGISIQQALGSAKAEIEPSGKMLYECMWKPIQKVMLNKKSLTQVGMLEVDQIFQVVARHLAQHHDIQIPFGKVWVERDQATGKKLNWRDQS